MKKQTIGTNIGAEVRKKANKFSAAKRARLMKRGIELPDAQMSRSAKLPKARTRHARCNQVLVILNNRLETVKLIREEIHPPVGDLATGPLELAVMRWHGLEIRVPLECVVFLSKLPPEPQWIEEAHAKVEQELASEFRASVRRAIRADRDEDRAGKRVMRKLRADIERSQADKDAPGTSRHELLRILRDRGFSKADEKELRRAIDSSSFKALDRNPYKKRPKKEGGRN